MKPLKSRRVFSIVLFCAGLILASCGRAPVPLPEPVIDIPTPPSLPLPIFPWDPPPSFSPTSMEETYAPIVILDSGEPSPLTSVEAHMRVGVALKGNHKKKQITLAENISTEVLAAYPKPTLEKQGLPHEVFIDARSQRAVHENTVYLHKNEIGAFTYLQYWFFYSFNDTKALGGPPGGIVEKCGNHEADWEHISLRINTELFKKAKTEADLRRAIDDIYLSQHTRFQHFERKWFRFHDPSLSFEGSHLKVYPANGSHATYPAPGKYFMQNLAGFKTHDVNDGLGLKIETHKGKILPLREQKWFAYAGRWGNISHDICNIIEAFTPASNDGPYGPGHGSQPIYFYQSDWHGHYRPPITPVPGYR